METINKTPITNRVMPNNVTTFRLYPLDSFRAHPRSWLKWSDKTKFKIEKGELHDEILLYKRKHSSKKTINNKN